MIYNTVRHIFSIPSLIGSNSFVIALVDASVVRVTVSNDGSIALCSTKSCWLSPYSGPLCIDFKKKIFEIFYIGRTNFNLYKYIPKILKPKVQKA